MRHLYPLRALWMALTIACQSREQRTCNGLPHTYRNLTAFASNLCLQPTSRRYSIVLLRLPLPICETPTPMPTSIRRTRCGKLGIGQTFSMWHQIEIYVFPPTLCISSSSLTYFTLYSFDIRGQTLIPPMVFLSSSNIPQRSHTSI
jgi:hypothetical protein